MLFHPSTAQSPGLGTQTLLPTTSSPSWVEVTGSVSLQSSASHGEKLCFAPQFFTMRVTSSLWLWFRRPKLSLISSCLYSFCSSCYSLQKELAPGTWAILIIISLFSLRKSFAGRGCGRSAWELTKVQYVAYSLACSHMLRFPWSFINFPWLEVLTNCVLASYKVCLRTKWVFSEDSR